MGFLDRLHKIVVAAGGSTKSVLGFTLGLPAASFKSDEYDSFIGDIYNSVVSHAKDISSSVLGPTGVAGTTVGAIPEPIRHPIKTATSPIFAGFETGYREGIAEPLSTFFTQIATADSLGTDELFSPQSWSRSYRISQHRSPGQSLAVAFDGVNPLDEAEVAKFIATDKGKIVSGMLDATSRVFLDPTVIGGKAAKVVRLAAITKPLTSAEDIARAVNSPRVAKFNDAITSIKREHGPASAAVIRDRFFPDHDAGSLISTVLAEAVTPQEQFLGIRALMGDGESLLKLDQVRSKLHLEIASLNKRADQLGPIKAAEPYTYAGTIIDPTKQSALFGMTEIGIPGDIQYLRDQVQRYYDVDTRVSRMQAGFSSIKESPKVGTIGEIRTSITHSDFYQKTPLGKTLQTFFHMNAHPVVNISDARSDIQLNRLMDEAELPQDIKDTFRAEYMRATDDASRSQIIIAAERTSVAHIAKSAGMADDELMAILDDIAKGRGEATEVLKSRVFNDDGSSVLTHQDEFGEWVETQFPAWVTQESTLLPLINMRELKSASTQFGQFRANHPAVSIPPHLANKFNRLWKPAVLLRPAWPIRVVGDEQFRIIAKIGALSHLGNLFTGASHYGSDFISSTRERGITNVLGKENRDIRQSFAVRDVNYRGMDFEGVFGTPEDIRRYTRDLASSAKSWQGLVGEAESYYLRELRTAGDNFKSVFPTDPDYPALYNWAVERFHSQPIARRLLAGESKEDILTFLHSTPEGSDILRANTVRAHNARNWIDDIDQQIDQYTAGNDELRSLFASGKATHDDLARLIPDADARPLAHGEALNQSLNVGYASQLIPSLIERAFDKLGRLPTDTLSRNPFMGHMYRAELKRQVDILGDTPITNTMKAQIEDRSRNYSLNETQKLLYDLAESSRFGEILGFLSPFYNAWQEVLTRWTGLAIENPAFAARARLIWRAPEKMGLVTDEDGNEIESGKVYSDDELSPNYRGKDRLIHIPLPSFIKDLPWIGKALGEKDSIAFNKKSFNLVLQGYPSTGPIVSIPLNEWIQGRPELAESLQHFVPFPVNTGSTLADIAAQTLPSAAKYFLSAAGEDEKFANTKARILFDKMTAMNEGRRPNGEQVSIDVLMNEAHEEAKAFTKLRGALSWVLPAAPVFQSPYQSYLDAFHQAQARYANDKNSLADEHGNPRTPDEYFLDTYQDEYFALTQAVTRSMNGIPPTLKSWEKQKEYKDLIDEFPELGGLIIGEDGAGEFNQAVYRAQLTSPLGPHSDQTQREPIPFKEAATDPQRRLGWIEYRRAMDLLEATRIQRGLPNLQVAAARDLAAAKAAVTEYLKGKYPSWHEDFNQTDKGKWEKKINALTVISSKPEMEGREDMKGIRDYLRAREEFNKALADRKKAGGAATLTASTNQDLAEAWNRVTGYLVERNLPFSAVFYRHLENDPLGL
jgi:hypothetical protein